MSSIGLDVIEKSRKLPMVGDLFVLKPVGYDYYLGRVIKTDAKIFTFNNCILVYVYNSHGADPVLMCQEPSDQDNFLLPPLLINRLPWSKGYFKTICNIPLKADDQLEQHVFRTYEGRLFDEYGKSLLEASGPVGMHGLWSYSAVGEAIQNKLNSGQEN